jgi:hypothetical protein
MTKLGEMTEETGAGKCWNGANGSHDFVLRDERWCEAVAA